MINGVLQQAYPYKDNRQIFLNKGNQAEAIVYGQVLTSNSLTSFINSRIDKLNYTISR